MYRPAPLTADRCEDTGSKGDTANTQALHNQNSRSVYSMASSSLSPEPGTAYCGSNIELTNSTGSHIGSLNPTDHITRTATITPGSTRVLDTSTQGSDVLHTNTQEIVPSTNRDELSGRKISSKILSNELSGSKMMSSSKKSDENKIKIKTSIDKTDKVDILKESQDKTVKSGLVMSRNSFFEERVLSRDKSRNIVSGIIKPAILSTEILKSRNKIEELLSRKTMSGKIEKSQEARNQVKEELLSDDKNLSSNQSRSKILSTAVKYKSLKQEKESQSKISKMKNLTGIEKNKIKEESQEQDNKKVKSDKFIIKPPQEIQKETLTRMDNTDRKPKITNLTRIMTDIEKPDKRLLKTRTRNLSIDRKNGGRTRTEQRQEQKQEARKLGDRLSMWLKLDKNVTKTLKQEENLTLDSCDKKTGEEITDIFYKKRQFENNDSYNKHKFVHT